MSGEEENLTEGDETGREHRVRTRLSNRLSHGTLKTFRSDWKGWEAFATHHRIDADDPRDFHIVAFIQARVLAGASWSSINHGLATLRQLLPDGVVEPAQRHLNLLWRDGLFDPGTQAPGLTVGQWEALYDAADHPLDRMLVMGLYRVPQRPRAWCLLLDTDVSAKRWTTKVHFPATITKTGTRQVFEVTDAKDARYVLARTIREYRKHRGPSSGRFLTDDAGQPLTPILIWGRLRQVAARAGISAFTLYSLRRSWAIHADVRGVGATVIQTELGHTTAGSMYRRYIDPANAILIEQGQDPAAHWLDRTRPDAVPIPVEQVRSGISKQQAYRFAAGTVEELLAGVDLPSLRVPAELLRLSREGLARGQAQFRTVTRLMLADGYDPAEPDAYALAEWVDDRLEEVAPSTVQGELFRYRIGFLDATGHDRIPGWDLAYTSVESAVRAWQAERMPMDGKLSRPATWAEVEAVCAASAERVPDAPPKAWAVTCLAWRTRARLIEILSVDDDQAVVRVEGRREVLAADPVGVLCPVQAARVLVGERVMLPQGVDLSAVLRSAQDYSQALRDDFAVVQQTTSGGRPADVSRARRRGTTLGEGGVVSLMSVSKGATSAVLPRPKLLWSPLIEDENSAANPAVSWTRWRDWWWDVGPLFPHDVTEPPTAGSRPVTSGHVSTVVTAAIERAGIAALKPYGFRYGRATRMHADGYSLEAIADVLGHVQVQTARGYIFDFDPDADGWAARSVEYLYQAFGDDVDALAGVGA